MNRQVYRVNDLSKHHLDGAPPAVALAEFLQGHWLLPTNAGVVVKGAEHVINSV